MVVSIVSALFYGIVGNKYKEDTAQCSPSMLTMGNNLTYSVSCSDVN